MYVQLVYPTPTRLLGLACHVTDFYRLVHASNKAARCKLFFMLVSVIGVERVSNIQGRVRCKIYRNFRTGWGRVSYARDTQVPTYYCALLYKPRLDFKPKNPLSINQARSFSCLSEIFIHAKTVKFIKVQQRHATATVFVSTGYLCRYQFYLPVVVTKQKIA